MTEKMIAIVLDVTRHNDRMNVITLYSRSRGRLSFLSPVGSGKSGKMRQSRLQPLAVIESDINFKTSSELQRLGAFSCLTVWHDIYFNPIKQIITLFLSEFLNRLLRATMPDENLWDYIFNSLRLLDNMQKGVANFHIAFLSSLLPFAGIQPDYSLYRPGYCFDMQSGSFKKYHEAGNKPQDNHDPSNNKSNVYSLHTHIDNQIPLETDKNPILSGEEAFMAAVICRVNFSNIRALRLNRTTRYRILQRLLQYYSYHFPGTGNIKSLDIIHEIFS